ncbi:MAG: nicotinate (nicotinamide) nucleotide adenylyltransferase [Flavobacteriales bacterium]
MKTGLFFGSFNPIHTGHLIVAQHFLNAGIVDEVWFVVSPLNPFKENAVLADAGHRAEMVRLAIAGNLHLCVSEAELGLPMPSYTADTMRRLIGDYPEKEFVILIGGDNLPQLHLWKDARWLFSTFPVAVFPRENDGPPNPELAGVLRFVDPGAPAIGISATHIRELVRRGLSIRYLTPDVVREYIERFGLYL